MAHGSLHTQNRWGAIDDLKTTRIFNQISPIKLHQKTDMLMCCQMKLRIPTQRRNIIVDNWSGTSTAAGCKRFSMAFHAKCFAIVFLIPIILNTSRYNMKLSWISNINTDASFFHTYIFYLPQKGCYSLRTQNVQDAKSYLGLTRIGQEWLRHIGHI